MVEDDARERVTTKAQCFNLINQSLEQATNTLPWKLFMTRKLT